MYPSDKTFVRDFTQINHYKSMKSSVWIFLSFTLYPAPVGMTSMCVFFPWTDTLNIKGNVAVAFQGVPASFKLCRKRLDVLEAANELLKKQVEESQSAIKSQQIHANLNAEN